VPGLKLHIAGLFVHLTFQNPANPKVAFTYRGLPRLYALLPKTIQNTQPVLGLCLFLLKTTTGRIDKLIQYIQISVQRSAKLDRPSACSHSIS